MRILSLVALGLLIVCCPLSLAQDQEAKGPDKKAKPKFTIAKDTTYLTEPLDNDGYVDYFKGLNDRFGKGATSENNANVLLWKAYGPQADQLTTLPPKYLKLLGIAELPKKGTYFSDFFSAIKSAKPAISNEEIDALRLRIMQRPWTNKEFPQVADWLKSNEQPLASVVAASKRTHYFSPLVPNADSKTASPLLSAILPATQRNRELAEALLIRGMQHAGEGRFDNAWQDLQACHRLARLIGRGGTLIDHLVSVHIDRLASEADVAFLDCAKLNVNKVVQCLNDLQNLPPIPLAADSINLCERLFFLDSVAMLDRNGLDYLSHYIPIVNLGNDYRKSFSDLVTQLPGEINWDPALRDANALYDRLNSAMRKQDRKDKKRLMAQIMNDVKDLKAKFVTEDWIKAFADPKAKPESRGKMIGQLLTALTCGVFEKIPDAGDRAEQIQRNLQLAFALAAYKSDNGKYPAKLDDLAPKYLPKIPEDLFSGKPLIYRTTADGFLLYSVGVNGIDDQGRTDEDDPPGDDLRVRMPLPALKK